MTETTDRPPCLFSEVLRSGELDGYRPGLPPCDDPLGMLACDAEVCAEAACSRCGRQGMEFHPFHADRSYRAFAVCPGCGHCHEF